MDPIAIAVKPSNTEKKQYKFYDLVMASFVTVLLCSNLIGAAKVCTVFGFTFGAGVLFFPISYVFGDILTEVYGYARARKVVWAGFAALIFASFMCTFIVALPPAASWMHQEAYTLIYGQAPRIAIASLVAFWAGEFSNSYILAKMKLATSGKLLWMRTIGSTIAGEGIDSLIFYPLAFWGVWPPELVLQVMMSNYAIKVGWEALLTPVTYKIVGTLKRLENEDYFDRDTNFTPFSLKT